ncbi:MAG: hypothetical protein PQ968_06605 [Methanobacterium sp.]
MLFDPFNKIPVPVPFPLICSPIKREPLPAGVIVIGPSIIGLVVPSHRRVRVLFTTILPV